jgi:hypothetical protein
MFYYETWYPLSLSRSGSQNHFITLPKTNKIYEVPFCSYVNKLLKTHDYLCLVHCVNSYTIVTLHFMFVGHIAKSSVEGWDW